MSFDFDTIVAISTPPGEGGISIVRLSGEQAVAIADKVYRMGRKSLKKQESHTIHYGHIMDPDTQEVIDEVMVSVMRSPKTYTREDVVEINTHGGMIPTQNVLQTVLRAGARLAEPGEFTKRAFLNGRLDLTQAEAVMDVIRSKTDKANQMALKQLDGQLSQEIEQLRQEILDTLAQVEVNIDYPEYDDVEEMTTALLQEKATSVKQKIEKLLQTAGDGKILRDGLKTAIIGRPNVGKSSLLNALIHEEKAIVTDIAGTTRDIVEEYISLRGIPLQLIDTAGIRETEDQVEKIGVERSRSALSEADLILLVLDQSRPLTKDDRDLLQATADQPRFILLNKVDLPAQIDRIELEAFINGAHLIHLSLMENQGLGDLEDAIVDKFYQGQIGERDANMISNTRHVRLLEEARDCIEAVLEGIQMGMPVDLVQIDLTRSWELLGEITGETVQDELLNQLFSQFCLGK